jgi:ABC-type polar amino acid transport system ATPase subunit
MTMLIVTHEMRFALSIAARFLSNRQQKRVA